MNILERFPIDTIRRFVANRLGVNPRELSMDYRCLSFDSEQLNAESNVSKGSRCRVIIPISFTFTTTAHNQNEVDVRLQLNNHFCGTTHCYNEVFPLINFKVNRPMGADVEFENLTNPFGNTNPEQILYDKLSFYYSVPSDFHVFEGDITPSIYLYSQNNVVGLTRARFEYLEFGIS